MEKSENAHTNMGVSEQLQLTLEDFLNYLEGLWIWIKGEQSQ